MSEKRFIQGGDTHIIDTETNAKYYAPCEWGLLDLLNEQQSVIDEQNRRIRKLEDILKKFQFPVERIGE